MTVEYLGPHEPTKERFRSQLIESPPSVISLDVETISLTNRIPLGFGIGVSTDESWWFPAESPEIELVKPLLLNPAIKKVFHNALFDLRCFPGICNVDSTNIADTNDMARLLGYKTTKLSTFFVLTGKSTTPAEEILASHNVHSMDKLPISVVAHHCMQDCIATLALYYSLIDKIVDKEYLDTEMKVIPILLRMSLRGLKIDQEELHKQINDYQGQKDFYIELCKSAGDFNPGSTQQVGYILTKRGNFLPTKRNRNTGKWSVTTNEAALKKLKDPLAQYVLSYRHVTKILSTYLTPAIDEDRIYTEYNKESDVGRINSARINMQNIPDPVRAIYVPDSGVFTSGDYSQEHLRILCYVSGDREMRRVYEDGEFDGDIHSKTAKELHIDRKIAKIINYAIPYGATPETLSEQAGIDRKVAERFLYGWFDAYREAYQWIKDAQEFGVRHMWALPTLFGRSIALPEEYDKRGNLNVEAVKRKAVNYPILGSDGEVMKRALILCDSLNLPLSITVHDSVVCDGDVQLPMEQLENITPFRLPMDVKKLMHWA